MIMSEWKKLLNKNSLNDEKIERREFPKKVLSKIKRYTNSNYHTEAYLEIAKELGDKHFISEFERIIDIIKRKNQLPWDEYEKRTKLYLDMMKKVKAVFINSDAVYKAT